MPRLSILFIRTALGYLTLGFTFGGLLLLNKGVPLSPFLWQLLPTHIEFLLVGWTVQLVMGVAFWILPRFKNEPKRGNIHLAWLAFFLINFGVWMAGLGPVISQASWAPAAGRSAEALGALAFFLHAWPRVKPFGV